MFIEFNENITFSDEKIIYKDGLGIVHSVSANNIHEHSKIKMVLSTKRLKSVTELNDITHEISVSNNIPFEKVSFFDYLNHFKNSNVAVPYFKKDNVENSVYSQVYNELPNLVVMKKIIPENVTNLDLFSYKHWVYNSDPMKFNENEHIPFLFYKKEDYNFFKTLSTSIINFIVADSIFYRKFINHVDNPKLATRVSLFFKTITPFKNILNKLDDTNKNNIVLFLYQVFDLNLSFYFDDEFSVKFSHLFKLISLDLIELILNDDDFFEDKDIELIDIKVKMYKKVINTYLYHYNYLNNYFSNISKEKYLKFVNHSSFNSLFYTNIENYTSFYNVVNAVHEFETLKNDICMSEIISYESDNIDNYNLFLNHKIIKIKLNDDLTLLCYPLFTLYDFEKESTFMSNCIRTKFKTTQIKCHNNNGDFSFNAYYHSVVLNSKQLSSINNINSLFDIHNKFKKDDCYHSSINLLIFYQDLHCVGKFRIYKNKIIYPEFNNKSQTKMHVSMQEIKLKFNKRYEDKNPELQKLISENLINYIQESHDTNSDLILKLK